MRNKTGKNLLNSLMTLALAAALVLPCAAPYASYAEAGTEAAQPPAAGEVINAEAADAADDAGARIDAGYAAGSDGVPVQGGAGDAVTGDGADVAGDDADVIGEQPDREAPDTDMTQDEIAAADEEAAYDEEDADDADDGREADAGVSISEIANISITPLKNGDRIITIGWEPVSGASYYLVYRGSNEPVRVKKSAEKTGGRYTCTYDRKILPGKNYRFTVKAFNKNDEMIGESVECKIKAANITFSEDSYRVLSDKSKKGSRHDYDLKDLLGEAWNGCSVVQGSCTDGTYAYYLMVSTYTQKGRVLKINLNDRKEIYRSGIINVCHGNGMAYDSDRHRLVVVGRESRRNQLTLIDADTLEFIKYKHVNYDREQLAEADFGSHRGLSAIAYIRKYDCFVALQRSTHDLLVMDPSFNVIGFIGTKISAQYPGTYQAMDADEKYVYLVLSYYSSAQPYNRIIALDWNSENLLDYINGSDADFARVWKCNNRNNGKPDAAIRLKTPYEAESLIHTTDSKGRNHFYLAEYYNNPKYHWVTKKQAYRAKWKKVTVKVKWKKVKGKWKYKKKKVWKYKTKYKDVRVYEIDHFRRDNYVYDLGVI